MESAVGYLLAAIFAISAVCTIFLIIAIIRRSLDGKNLNPIIVTNSFATLNIIIFSTLIFVSAIIVIPANQRLSNSGTKLTVILSGWESQLDGTFCTVSAYLVLFLPSTFFSMGIMLSYIPFWTTNKSRLSKTQTSLPFLFRPLALFLFLNFWPAMKVVIYFLVASRSKAPIAVNYFFCQYDMSIASFAIVQIADGIITCLSISYFTGFSLYRLINFRSQSTALLGHSCIPEDAIVRSAILGGSCAFMSILSIIDNLVNLYDPSFGSLNGVPYIMHFSVAFLGSGSLVIWGTTDDLITYVPFLQTQMRNIQEKMKATLSLVPSTTVISGGTKSSNGGARTRIQKTIQQ